MTRMVGSMADVFTRMEGPVAVVSLAKSVTNPLGDLLVGQLLGIVQNVRDDPEAKAMVLTSASDRFFSIGLDIPELIEFDKDRFADFAEMFDRLCLELYALPKPTVAAITGHATAGGAILALCADHRVMTSGRAVMGLNEVKLGVTVPWTTVRMLRDLVGGRSAARIMEMGDFYNPEESLAMGMVDEVVPPDEVGRLAIELATSLAASPTEAYAAIKGSRTAPVVAEIEAELEERRVEFVDLWYSPHAQEQLETAMLKF
jgi:enoyl-CoA hydratase/carnithine racemase